ncbi:hypothetical protein Stsp02_21820 [Streptomyces sp. NBRC 14336]|uniref:hypothetical protein n=1 Tax=Streptomyces sp. NBRC 14336 TaxID=3030992 RepID=UPI0024A12749|nr:hypothetical protein [Streptomyces sp. NBRC 14336]WBO81834.1 hypothetical protein SBE_005714 [Streptomyces sp. SBE_14.2]GLW46520.1 hypothetical protein Stsp02_21820 [Streptomyces sp. NBRC 14336]
MQAREFQEEYGNEYASLEDLRQDDYLVTTVERFRELIDAANEMNHEEFQRSLPNECRMRWTACYVTLYSEDKASHLGIFGYSGD